MGVSASRIEICGGIASGKTTLCTLLENSNFRPVLEDFKKNPFWQLFYKDPELHAFETEVTFLLQHYCLIKSAENEIGQLVCDFALLQDRAYADVNLNGGRGKAFRAVYGQVTNEIAGPALIVHLECSAEIELARIHARARPEEDGVKIEYLDALNRAIAREVSCVSSKTRILTIDSAEEDFAYDPHTRKRVEAAVLSAIAR